MEAYERGMATRREVLGDEHVDRAVAGTDDLDADFQRWITENVWNGVWSRDGLDRRTRTLVTIAILASLGVDELRLHVEAAANTGTTPEDIAEVLMHVGVYAGVPAAHSAFKVVKEIYGGTDD